MGYGYRVFTVELVENHRHNPEQQDWVLAGGVHYMQEVRKALKELVDSKLRVRADPGTTWGRDRTALEEYVVPPGATSQHNVARWISSEEAGPFHQSVQLEYGKMNSARLSIGKKSSTSLEGRAPGHPFRAELILPADGTARGALVVEAIGRPCPQEAFHHWLAIMSDIFSNRAGSDPRLPSRKLILNPATDRAHLEELVSGSQKATIELRGAPDNTSGVPIQASRARLSFDLDWSRLPQLIEALLNRLKTGDKDLAPLIEVVGADDLGERFEFGDGTIYLRTPGEQKVLRWANIEDIFTYPITEDIAPIPEVWSSTVSAKVQTLMPHLDW